MINLNLQDYKGYYSTISGITKKNTDDNGTTYLPVTEDFSAPLWMKDPITGKDAYMAEQLCNGKSYIAIKDDTYTEENPILIVRVFNSEGIIEDKKVNVNNVDPKNADFLEMYAYSAYLENSGKVPDAHNYFMSAVFDEEMGNDFATNKGIASIKKNYLNLVKEYMELQLETGMYEPYLAIKKLYDFMNSN